LNRQKLSLLVAIAAALALVLTACGSSSSNNTSPTSSNAANVSPGSSSTSSSSATAGFQTIRYDTTPGSVATIELASYLGYIPGIAIRSVGVVLGGPASIQATATGADDIGEAFNGTIVAAVAAGAKLKAVIGAYGSDDKAYNGILVKSNSPIHSAKDLIGKTVGVNTLGANATEVSDVWLAKEGLTPAQIKQVEFVVVSPTQAAEALEAGRIDAAFLSVQDFEPVLGQDKVRSLMTDIGVLGPYTGGSFVLSPSFIQSHPAETRELVTGLAKANHWLQVTPRAKVVSAEEKILVLHGRRSDAKFIDAWQSAGVAEPYGYIKPTDFSEWFAPMEAAGQLKPGQVTLSRLYTNEFNAYAPH
jgi:ABC-type nitrate/sulfonate/bicarbonate transport system substrate-binding protein